MHEAITSTLFADGIIPVFTAPGTMSVTHARICSCKKSGVTSETAKTPVVFCAVSAVIALIAYTPCAVIVFMSA